MEHLGKSAQVKRDRIAYGLASLGIILLISSIIWAGNPPGSQDLQKPDLRRWRLRAQPAQVQGTPRIRFIAPTWGPAGTAFTLAGRDFDPTPAGNTIQFELPNGILTAQVTSATDTAITGIVPDGVEPSPIPNAERYYRVTVTTDAGTSNGVGFRPFNWPSRLDLRPDTSTLLLSPGSGKEVLVIGGGTPPYTLMPLDASQQTVLTAVLKGNVVELTGTASANVDIVIQDSANPPATDTSTVYLRDIAFFPTMEVSFYTLLAGSAPSLVIESEVLSGTIMTAQTVIQIENADLDLSALRPGSILGLIEFGRYGSIDGYRHLGVTDVNDTQADFDLISLEDGGMDILGYGAITRDPPALALHVAGLGPEALVPRSAEQKLMLSDQLLRLPATPGETFRLTATYTSVSVTPEYDHPLEHTVSQDFVTTSPGGNAPRLERLLPTRGEAGRYVRIRGTGFGASAETNTATFAGAQDTRVPARIHQVTDGEIIVPVPVNAVTGPVHVEVNGQTSNDYLFEVRFRPQAGIFFTELKAGTPAGPIILFEQPSKQDQNRNPNEFADEVRFASVSFLLDAGAPLVSGLSLDQVVGHCEITDLRAGGEADEYEIWYDGQEPNEPQRHLLGIGLKGKSLAKIYVSAGEDGNGVRVDLMNDGRPLMGPGVLAKIQFDEPVYQPPATPGMEVNTRTEVVSVPWTGIPFSEMRVITLGIVRVQ